MHVTEFYWSDLSFSHHLRVCSSQFSLATSNSLLSSQCPWVPLLRSVVSEDELICWLSESRKGFLFVMRGQWTVQRFDTLSSCIISLWNIHDPISTSNKFSKLASRFLHPWCDGTRVQCTMAHLLSVSRHKCNYCSLQNSSSLDNKWLMIVS